MFKTMYKKFGTETVLIGVSWLSFAMGIYLTLQIIYMM